MPQINEAKKALDVVIKKSHVHFYKPIQIAEILYHYRNEKRLDLETPDTYKNVSKRWRDEVSIRLIGRRSTSSQKYQDNLFDANAIPPHLLTVLGSANRRGRGFIEAYIYKSLEARLASVYQAWKYVQKTTPQSFQLKELVSLFVKTPGLRRSIDKMYEICVYALFSTIVRALQAKITLELGNEDKAILTDFEQFIKTVLGINAKQTKLTLPAALYRVGVTNAADRGLDMWANFGAAVQVKHLTLKPEVVEEIAENITADRIVIVCLDVEKEEIANLLKQVGWAERIQGIITLSDLDEWYHLCLSNKYKDKLGRTLLPDLLREFEAEFPSSEEIAPFLRERGYDRMPLPTGWVVS